MTEPVRKQIGDYEIIRELGHGGMGQVFLVRNLISDRIEAMKILLPDLANQGDLGARFMREIKLLASLDHPNIAALRTAFSADNQLIMIMEYVEGDTLAHLLERGPFPPAEALNYIDQVLAALSYAHAKGIIHRDIKPANMMLTPRGVLKLMDFGIARSGNDLGLTMTGATLGSLDYMSPEQVQSQPTDARSDLYSVGVSLYEMVTGQRMFSATSSYSIMEAHVKETPRPPIEVQPSLPKQLSDMIVMAVAKNPADRFQTADAFHNALSQIKESCGSPVTEKAAVAAASTGIGSQSGPVVTPVNPPTPVSQSSVGTSSPPANVSSATDANLKRDMGSRRPFLVLAIAILLLVASLAGARAYRVHQQNAAAAAAMAAMSESNPAPTSPSPSIPAPANPAQAQPQAAPTAGAPPASSAADKRATHARMNAAAAAPPAPSDAEAQQEQAAMEQQKKLLDEMEVENDHLESRAAAVESSLDALEQQMHQSGLGLRGDMVSARASMRTDMAKAKQALDNSDTERARRYLDMANQEISKLEAFLGRR
ncbi:MAG: serine/threonine-protein kinase [Candidatus Korobacteraceae bacterium]